MGSGSIAAMKADPAGTIRQRADGSVWEKPTSKAKEWTQVKDGVNSTGTRVPGQGGIPDLGDPSEADYWTKAQDHYDLDGHKPSKETHPQHVDIDAEGDIDKKPVLMWKDDKGNDRRSYTKRFHWNRYSQVHEKTRDAADAMAKAHEYLASCCGSDHPDREAAMAASVHLKTGRPINDVLTLHPEATHVARKLKKSGASDLMKGQTTDKLREILTASMALRDRTQSFHWNVTGPTFPQLHVLFGDQYDDLADAVDVLAERLRGFQIVVDEVAIEPREMPADAQGMLVELIAAHEQLSELCEQGVEAAEAEGDAGTVDILGKRAADHDKAAWFLRSTAGLQKGGSTEDAEHPDKAHFMFAHPRGHAYMASVHDPVVAEHVASKRQSGEGRVFNAKPSQVKKMIKKAGVGHYDPETIMHAGAALMCADYLSKTPKFDLAKEGMTKAAMYVRKASDKVARHYGHDTCPSGMSYCPPGVAMGYLEDLGAAKLFPKAFESLKMSDAPSSPRDEVRSELKNDEKMQASYRQRAESAVMKAFGTLEGREADIERIVSNLERKNRKINKGKLECSQNEDATFTPVPAPTTSSDLPTSSSTTPTSTPKSTTPGQSLQYSAKLMELNPELEKGGQYLARLSPGQEGDKARYVFDKTAFLALVESDHFANIVTPGVKFFCPMHTGEGLVDGFISIEKRVDDLLVVSHDGTGKRGTTTPSEVQKMLLEYHMPMFAAKGDCSECEGCEDCEEWDDEAENMSDMIVKATDMTTHVDVVKADGIPDEYNKPRRIRQGEPGYGKKKFVVNARNGEGKTRVIRFGDANMEIRRDDPKRRANFRSRHGCDTPAGKDILTAKYWSCQQWRGSEKVVKSNMALQDWGTVQPEHELKRAEAQAVYVEAMRRALAGEMDDETMLAMSRAVLARDYDKVLRLAKGEEGVKPVSAPREARGGAASARVRVPSGGGADHPGPKALPIGAQRQRNDGIYVKTGEHKWSKQPERVRGKKNPAEGQSSGPSASEESLRERIMKLRGRLRGATSEERGRIVTELTKLKARLKQARRASGRDTSEPKAIKKGGEGMEKAVWSTAKVNDLPDSAFLYIEPGGKKDSEGKTTPRSLRHLPYRDASGKIDLPHLRNALARLAGTDIPESVKAGIRKRAERFLESTKDESVKKANLAIAGLVDVSSQATDPVDLWLAKGLVPTAELDRYILESEGTFTDFAEDLSVAPTIVRSQAHYLRMAKGPLALRAHYMTVKGSKS